MGELLELADKVKGGSGSLLLASWATYAGTQAKEFPKPYDDIVGLGATSFLYIGGTLLVILAVKGVVASFK
jgi:hypothetical protein